MGIGAAGPAGGRGAVKGTPIQGRQLTPRAQRWLARAEPGEILHLFPRACNLIDARGRVLSLILDQAAHSPFSFLLEAHAAEDGAPGSLESFIQPGSAVRIQGANLSVGRLEIRWDGLPVWDPRPDWTIFGQSASWLRDHPGLVLDAFRDHTPQGSLLCLLQDLPRPASIGLDGGAFNQRALARARAAALELSAALTLRQLAQLARAAGQLAGLGGGLTPAGDDLLVGAMHACFATLPQSAASALASAMAEAASPHTVPLSAAWLQAAAQGEASFLWHAWLQALHSREPESIQLATVRLLRHGHTSGADALCGFLISTGWEIEGQPAGSSASPAR
jgi:hypothetical protein